MPRTVNKVTIKWPSWDKLINQAFVPLIDNKDRYLICYGGRGSSKSDFAAKKLIFRCLSASYFRCVLIRNSYASIKDSSFDQIKQTIIDLGLEDYFDIKISPLEIRCKLNNNLFIARGCDDTTKLKSLKDFTCVWYEEDIPTEDDFITITTSIRTTKADYLQEIFTINPEVEGNYQEHWFYKRFFDGHYEKSFSDVKVVKIDNDQEANITYTVHHSTYRDNKWIPNSFIAYLIQLKQTNPYYYQIYCEGNWGNRQLGGLAYKKFVRGTHCNRTAVYNPDLALHLSFDFNVKPYSALTIWQIEGKNAKCIDTIALRSPNNGIKYVCREFVRRYNYHAAGVFIYGDPSGRNQDTKMEDGFNNYSIIEMELTKFKPDLRVARKHPAHVMRLNFINTIFESSFNGINIEINDEKCTELITDLMFQKENADGTKLKEKTTKNGETYEKYGHMSDTFDYFMCEAFSDDFHEYQHGPTINIKQSFDASNNQRPGWSW